MLGIAVAVVVVLGVVYVLVSASQPQWDTRFHATPSVTLSLSSQSSTGADVLVAGAQPTFSPSGVTWNLAIEGVWGVTPAAVAAVGTASCLPVQGSTYCAVWQNPYGTGLLTQGDHFLIRYPNGSAPAAGTILTFALIWTDGTTLAQQPWQV